MCRDWIGWLFRRITFPLLKSLPAKRLFAHGSKVRLTAIIACAFDNSDPVQPSEMTSSILTHASKGGPELLCGKRAPVIISTHGYTLLSLGTLERDIGSSPAAIVPSTANLTGDDGPACER